MSLRKPKLPSSTVPSDANTKIKRHGTKIIHLKMFVHLTQDPFVKWQRVCCDKTVIDLDWHENDEIFTIGRHGDGRMRGFFKVAIENCFVDVTYYESQGFQNAM
jgi:hypothetical protein